MSPKSTALIVAIVFFLIGGLAASIKPGEMPASIREVRDTIRHMNVGPGTYMYEASPATR